MTDLIESLRERIKELEGMLEEAEFRERKARRTKRIVIALAMFSYAAWWFYMHYIEPTLIWNS